MTRTVAKEIVVYTTITLLLWYSIWSLIFKLSGFYLGSITINNGILFNNIHLCTSRFEVHIVSFRFRLWGNSRRLIIDGFHLTKLQSKPKRKATLEEPKNKPLSNQPFELSLFPSNPIGRFVCRLLVKYLPKIGIELKRTSFQNHDKKTIIGFTNFSSFSRISTKNRNNLKYEIGLLCNHIHTSSSHHSDNIYPLFSLTSIRNNIKFSIDLTTGRVHTIKVKVLTDDLRLLVFKLVKLYLDIIEDKIDQTLDKNLEPSKPTKQERIDAEIKNQKKVKRLERLIKVFNVLYNSVDEVSILNQSINIYEIPFLTAELDKTAKQYFQDEYPKTSVELLAKSMYLNGLKLNDDSAGFHALFESSTESPLNYSSSIQQLTLRTSKLVDIEGSIHKKLTEVLNIPSYSLNLKANYLDKLAKGEGFENCIAEIFFACSSPVLDLDSNFIRALFYNFLVIRKFLKYKKIHKHYKDLINIGFNSDDEVPDYDDGESSSDSSFNADTTLIDSESTPEPSKSRAFPRSSKTPLKDKLWNYLQEYYPRLDVKFVIEQPRLIVRHSTSTAIELLNYSYSSLNLEMVTTRDRDYELNCQVLSPAVSYIQSYHGSDKVNRFEILYLNSVTIQVDILKNFKFRFDFDFHSLKVNLEDLKIFTGIRTIITDLTDLIEKDLETGSINLAFNSKIARYQKFIISTEKKKNSKSKGSLIDLIFNYFPPWILEFKLSIDGVDMKFGSRSVLIPVAKLSDTFDDFDFRDFVENLNKNANELRCFRLKFDSLGFHFENNAPVSRYPYQSSSSSDINSASLDTLTSKTDSSVFWKNKLSLKDLQLSSMCDFNEARKYNSLLTVPHILIDLESRKYRSKDNLNIVLNLHEIFGKLDHYKIFTIIGSLHLLKENLIKPFQLIKSRMRKEAAKIHQDLKRKSIKSLKEFLSITTKIKRVDLSATLNDSYDIRLDSYDTRITFANDHFIVYGKFFRLLTKSPTLKNYWCRLLCTDDFQIKINLNDLKHLQVHTSLLKIMSPHMHTTYKLFDNLSVTLKILKHSIRALKDRDSNKELDYTVVHPSESSAKEIPTINFKANSLVFNIEDDPFESELGMIYQLGKVEQRKRMEMYSLFELNVLQSKSSGKQTHSESSDDDESLHELDELNRIISSSWIRKVKSYKKLLNDELVKNKKFIFGNEAKLDSKFQSLIQPYSIHAPLLLVIMDGLDMNISKPKFNLKELPQFLYDFGQGLPLDTKFSLIIPTYLDLKIRELRIHLRDYPLPLLYVPSRSSELTVRMCGNLVIAESLVTEEANIRNLVVDLVQGVHSKRSNQYYRLEIEKTMATVKIYTDMTIEFKTPSPSRFVWGQSYQFAIQQVMLSLDQFSKPPVDPSPKLGFWDKLRLVLHGKFMIHCSDGPLEVAFKGSRDPYDVFGASSGFILSFSDNVCWTINEDFDSRNFCNVKAEKVVWYIPNYLASGLVSWIRDTKKLTYLPKSEKFITSCYAYYLDDDDYSIPKSKASPTIFEKKVVSLSGGVQFKVGFVLERDAEDGQRTDKSKNHYDVKLCNPKYTEEGHDSYQGFKSDYINMAISLDANFLESYNSIYLSPKVFLQFFNWWKLFSGNMQLPIRRGTSFGEIKKSKKFSQHLVSNRFKFNFKSLFISHIYRDDDTDLVDDLVQCYGVRGKMDSFSVDLHQRKEKRIAVHLSKNRNTHKMNFHIADMHLLGIDLRLISAKFYHNVYKSNATENKESKYHIFDNDLQWFDIEDFEEAFMPSMRSSRRVVTVLPLLYSKRFSYLRDTEPDVRFKEVELFNFEKDSIMQANDVFEAQRSIVQERIKHLKDYMKSNHCSPADMKERIDVLNEEIKRLQKNEAAFTSIERRNLISNVNARFNNKFLVMRMLLKWNNKNRNLLFKYIHFVQLKKFFKKYMNFESISALEDLIRKSDQVLDSELTEQELKETISKMRFEKDTKRKNVSCQSKLNQFDQILLNVENNQQVIEDYLFEILSPQIQLQSNETPDSVILVSSPSIDAKMVSVYDKSKNRLLLDIDELENRLGVIVNDSNVLVFDKDPTEKSDSFIFDKLCYGSNTNWPPWLGIEVCNKATLAGKQHVLLENTSVMVMYTQAKPLNTQINHLDDETDRETTEDRDSDAYFDSQEKIEESIEKKLQVFIPKVSITSTSAQYFSLYFIIMNLLLYTEPSNKELNEKLEKLKFSINFQDLSSLYERIRSLHLQNCTLAFMNNNYTFRQENLTNETLNEHLALKTIQEQITSEMYLLLHSIMSGNLSGNDISRRPVAEWFINADEIILHMLDDDRIPILDIAMAKGSFRRIINEDESNINRIEISMIQGFNLLSDARFPAFLEPMNHQESGDDEDQNLITVDWSMYSNVGGIKLIENFEFNSQPLSLRADKVTGDKLMEFLFKSDLDNLDNLDESPILKTNKDSDSNEESKDKEYVDIDDVESDSEESEELFEAPKTRIKFDSSEEGDSNKEASKLVPQRGNFTKSFTQSSTSEQQYDENLDEMVSRSKTYISINNLKINPLSLLISIKLKGGYKRLVNVDDFKVMVPEIILQKKVMSMLEVTMFLKKILIKTILGHVGGLLKNKMKRKRHPLALINKPLKPLKDYAKFTPVADLRATSNQTTEN